MLIEFGRESVWAAGAQGCRLLGSCGRPPRPEETSLVVTRGATKVVSLFHSRVTAPQTVVGDVGSLMRGNCQLTFWE